MARRACDGDGLLGAFRAAVANLEAHVDEINALNVYPVPGWRHRLEHARDRQGRARRGGGRRRPAGGPDRRGHQLRGADGRARQLRRHHQPDLPGHGGGPRRQAPVQRPGPGPCPVEGARTAYGAVAKPVEGTILTVIRESAAAAVEAAERDNDIESVLAATLAGAEKSVARTPSLLAILREAGVVDSGGQGLYRLFQGRCSISSARRPVGRPPRRAPAPEAVDARRACR